MERKNDLRPWLVIGGLLLASNIVARIFPDTYDPGADNVGDELDQEPTLSRERMTMLADIIHEALLGSPWTEDEDSAIAAILYCNNDADIAGLISIFGTRQGGWGQPHYTLPGAVRAFLSASDIARLNTGLTAKGITFLF